jgi:DNA topoisomerase-3
MAANLLKYRRSGPFQGFISKKKRRFPACLRIVDHGGAHKVEFDFNTGKEKQGQDPGGPARSSVSSWAPDSVPGVMKMSTLPDDHPPALCPVCRGGIIEGNRGFGCSNWRVNDGDCRFVIWKTILGKTLTPDNIATLAAGKKTRPYVFKHDNDVKFTATLKMIEKDRAFFIQVEPTQGQGDIINVSCQR